MRACRDRESGFALLLVLLMAAIIAISLYSEIPRVAFQSQRQKEQLLVERGEQYKRALQMFVTTLKRYPTKVEELETFNGRHFLRHKYVDPMTGKAEWRIIHVQGNFVVDSVMSKPAKSGQQAGSQSDSTSVTAYAGIGQTAEGTQGTRPQDRRRATEGGTGEGVLPFPTASPGLDTGGPPSTQPSADASSPSGTPPSGTPPQLGVAGAPGAAPPGTVGYSNGPPGQPGQPPGAPGQPGSPNPASPGAAFPPGANTGASLINDLLTRPNPQGAAIVQQALQQQGGGAGASLVGVGGLIYAVPPNLSGSSFSGGSGGSNRSSGSPQEGSGLVAGVASKAQLEGIMVYNDRTAYDEWEFIFDPSKVPPIPASIGSTGAGTPGSQGRSATSGGGTGFGFGGQGGQGGSGQRGAGGGGGSLGGGLQLGGQGQQGAAGMQTTGAANLPTIRMGRP
jgi:uncharacterized membrane protein YgcG